MFLNIVCKPCACHFWTFLWWRSLMHHCITHRCVWCIIASLIGGSDACITHKWVWCIYQTHLCVMHRTNLWMTHQSHLRMMHASEPPMNDASANIQTAQEVGNSKSGNISCSSGISTPGCTSQPLGAPDLVHLFLYGRPRNRIHPNGESPELS